VTYLTDTSEHPEGYGGSIRGLWSQHVLEALDYKTGDLRWSHAYTNADTMGGGLGGPGILTTGGDLLFSGDFDGNLIAFSATKGDILWHFPMRHSLGNGPETYLLDGRQYLIAGGGDTLYAFALN
jgi:alcohol dehydrogenase (cytochrome c)